MKNSKENSKENFALFNFWKGNRKNGFFQLSPEQVVQKFKDWLSKKEKDWLDYYDMTTTVAVFISEELDSIGNTENDFAEYRELEKILKPIKREYLTSKQFQQ